MQKRIEGTNFVEVIDFKEDSTPVHGIIDEDELIVIPQKYAKIEYHKGYFIAKDAETSEFSLFDNIGQHIFPPMYDSIAFVEDSASGDYFEMYKENRLKAKYLTKTKEMIDVLDNTQKNPAP